MKKKKNLLIEKVLKEFDKNGGGTAVEESFTSDPSTLKTQLQNSFDKIFPDLVKKTKLRKHVIFEEDVFEIYVGLSKSLNCSLSSLINQTLREFANEKIVTHSESEDLSQILQRILSLKEEEDRLISKVNSEFPTIKIDELMSQIKEQKTSRG